MEQARESFAQALDARPGEDEARATWQAALELPMDETRAEEIRRALKSLD